VIATVQSIGSLMAASLVRSRRMIAPRRHGSRAVGLSSRRSVTSSQGARGAPTGDLAYTVKSDPLACELGDMVVVDVVIAREKYMCGERGTR
jgi:hypothetical protein